jgi:glycosyltransferase involved in cell wall biosynthesis
VGPKKLVFVRTGPLNMTPAVERYAAFLRESGFTGELSGVELDFQPDRKPVTFVDTLDVMKASYRSSAQRLWMMARWQLFQLQSLWRRRPEVIQICDVFSAIPALILKWTRGTTLVFDVRDPAGPTLRHWGRIPSALLDRLEAFTAARSDVVVMVSEPLRQRLDAATQAKTVVVPNAPLEDRFERLHFSADGKLRVSVAGFISLMRNLEPWCEVARREPDVVLDLYGAVYEDRTRALLERYGYPPPRSLSHAEAMARMVDADLVSLMYDPSLEIHTYAAPNKFFDALMLGKPVLCSRGMRLAEEIEEAGCGLAVTYGDAEALRAAVVTLRDPAVRARMGEAARRLFETRYLGAPQRARAEVYRRAGVLAGS